MMAAGKKVLMNTFIGELLVAVGISLFIYVLAGFFFPFLLVLPLPLLIFSLKRGLPAGLFSLAVVTAILTFASSGADLLSLIVILCAGTAGMIILRMAGGVSANSGIMAILILVPLVMVPAVLGGLERISPSSVQGYSKRSYLSLEKSAHTMMDEHGIAAGNRKEIERMLVNGKWLLDNLYPALFAAFAVISALISLAVADRCDYALTGKKMKWPKIRNLRVPETAALIFAVSGAGTLLLSGKILFVMSNLLVFSIFIFLIQGLALIAFLNHTFGITPFVQSVIYLALLLFSYSPILLAAAGMLDIWVPMRRKIEDLHHKLSENFE